jgi:hypothetical protein
VRPALSAAVFTDWLAAWGAAWTEKDAAAMAALFTAGGRFTPNPFDPLIRGREAIAAHWREEFARQINPAFDFEIWIAYEATGLAHWRARLTRVPDYDTVERDGALRALFDLEGASPLCKRLELWSAQAVVSGA